MVIRKLAWLAVEGSLIGLYIAFGSGSALALAVGLILVPVCSAVLHLFIRDKLRLELKGNTNLRRGTEGTLTIRVEDPTVFPVHLGGILRVENQLNGQITRLRLEWDSGEELTVRLGSEHCGRLAVTVQKLRLYDCFGLIGIPVKTDAKCHVTVQPEGFETVITLSDTAARAEDAESYSQERPGWDLTEVYQLRDYVPGDSPRQIHWKLSGKFDRLIVRDPGEPIVRDLLLFWERTGGKSEPGRIDAQAEAVFSIASALLEQSMQLRLGWNDTREERCVILEIAELEDLIGALPRLLSAAGSRAGESGAGMLLRTRPDALCSHMVYIADAPGAEVKEWQRSGHVTVLCSGDGPNDGAVCFDETNYETRLAMLEL